MSGNYPQGINCVGLSRVCVATWRGKILWPHYCRQARGYLRREECQEHRRAQSFGACATCVAGRGA